MTQRTIAIIGTAGRSKANTLIPEHWDFMATSAAGEITKSDILASGGAAWADHVAVWAYLNDLCAGLHLHLPAPFNGYAFEGGYGTSGGACNYYHEKFGKTMGFNSFLHIKAAIDKGAVVTEQSVGTGYGAMAKRNLLVADECTHMLAYTFGIGDEPMDGGTKITWDMAKDKARIHVPLPHFD